MNKRENNAVNTDDFFATFAEKYDGTDLRGKYSKIDAQYVLEQEREDYNPLQHMLLRRLYQRQAKLIPGRACDVFIENLERMNIADGIPHFERSSTLLFDTTGWRLVAGPRLVPDHIFFDHLATRRFPLTVWLREPGKFDHIVEPDVFHDFFGHVPLLFNPIFADHLQKYGKGGLKALRLDGLAMLARLY